MPFLLPLLGLFTISGGVLLSTGCKDGKDGTNGTSTKVTTEKVLAGAECGDLEGLKVITSTDSNGNGTYETNEQKVNLLCQQRVDGYNSFVDQIVVGAGDLVCPYGGVQIISGLDVNEDNVIDAEEISFDNKVCNGADGQDGFSSLVKLNPVAIGSLECQFGGTSVDSGLDTNRDGILSNSEIQYSNIICSVPVNRNQTLVKNSLINPGGTCQYGGVKTEVGIDDNDDRVLQASEVDSHVNKCNQVALISGLNSKIKTTSATSNQCAYGGFVFKAGLDDNYNNILDGSEVESTEIICNGYDGLTSLTNQVSYSGYNCGENGGIRFETGLDLDENGTLDFDEIEAISHICNGDDGVDGVQAYDSLIDTFDAGSACGSAGGYYIETGLDLDFDGVLDSSEVETENLICNGFNGFNTLVDVTEDTFYCFGSGIVVETGLDLDEDGYLDYSEIEVTSYICND